MGALNARRWVATDFTGIDGLRFVETEVPEPAQGEVTIEVRAAGVNPADWKHVSAAAGGNAAAIAFPVPVGYEVSGVIAAIGPDTHIASGGGAVGDEVLAFRTVGGYATALNVKASSVFAKPASLSFPEAAGLLLTAATAKDMMRVTGVKAGDVVLVHGASGAVGVAALQLLRNAGARAIGTASERNRSVVEGFGGTWVPYGDDLVGRVTALGSALGPVTAAFDCVGTDEAVDSSLALLEASGAGAARFVTIAAARRADAEGLTAIGGRNPDSSVYRDSVRAELIATAAAGDLVVPLGPAFPLAEADQALRLLSLGHPGGKLTLIA